MTGSKERGRGSASTVRAQDRKAQMFSEFCIRMPSNCTGVILECRSEMQKNVRDCANAIGQ